MKEMLFKTWEQNTTLCWWVLAQELVHLRKQKIKSWQDLKTNTKPTLTAHVEAEPKHQKREWTLPAGHLKMGTSSSGCREVQRLPACVQRHNQIIVFRFKSMDGKESERHPQDKPTTVSQKSSPWTTRKEPPSAHTTNRLRDNRMWLWP